MSSAKGAVKNYPTKFLVNNIVWVLLILAVLIMGLIDSSFYSMPILKNILIQSAVLGVITVGMAHVILMGEIDLSVVGVLGFSAGLGTVLMSNGFPWYLAIVITILFGVLVGFINGVLVTKLKAAALIQTLAVSLILEGALMALTEGATITNFPDAYTWLGQSSILGFPTMPIPFIFLFILVYFVWNKTVFGRSLFAAGGNPSGAYVSGINVSKVKIATFTIAGGTYGLGGYMLSSYMGAVTTNFGSDLLMYGLAAAVIGGISLKGGKGRIMGVLGGVLLLTAINVGLQILGINTFYVTMAGGLMIFIAVIIDALKNMYFND